MKSKYLIIWLTIAITIVFSLYRLGARTGNNVKVASNQKETPTILLFKGDNSASCQKIHHLVEQAKTSYQNKINIVSMAWSDDNPLIKQYKIQFLPTVVFIDKSNREVGRIVGESPAVQERLKQALSQANQLLEQ